jgi:uncharacterized protein (DUF2252 family)
MRQGSSCLSWVCTHLGVCACAEVNGSVYFDVASFDGKQGHVYGKV